MGTGEKSAGGKGRTARAVTRLTALRRHPLAKAFLVVLFTAFAGLSLHIAAELIARPDTIRTHVLDGFSQRLVGDDSIASDLIGVPQRHFSECMVFSILTNPRVEGVWLRVLKAEANLWTPPKAICSTFLEGQADPAGVRWFSYARYWHGYLVFHKTILSFFDYRTFLKFVNLLLVVSLVVFAATLSARFRILPAAAFIAVFVGLSPILWSWFDPTQAISFSALLAALAIFSRFGADRNFTEAIYVAVFVGALFNFFDFLYFPALLAAGICWLFALHSIRSRDATIDRSPVLLGLAGLGGYMLMWVFRWEISFFLMLFGGAQPASPGDFSRWMFGGDSAAYVPFAAILQILQWTLNYWLGYLVVALLLAGAAYLTLRHGRRFILFAIQTSLIPVALGVLILELKARHSLAHGYSIWVVSGLVALCAFNWVYYLYLPDKEDRRRTVAVRPQKISWWPFESGAETESSKGGAGSKRARGRKKRTA